MRRGFRLCLPILALLAHGCHSNDALLGLGAPCSTTDECVAELSCTHGRCRKPCANDAVCGPGVCALTAASTIGACSLPGENGCTAGRCATGLICAADDICRLPCSSALNCAPGHLCLHGACFDGLPGSDDGWLVFTSNATGRAEVWAARDDGSQVVRLTDQMGGSAGAAEGLHYPLASPDGEQIIFASSRNPSSSEYDALAHLYRVAPDGAGLAFLSDQGNQVAASFAGAAWESDSRHLVFVSAGACSNRLLRMDAIDSSEPEVLFDPATPNGLPLLVPSFPVVHPKNARELFVWEQPCGKLGALRRVNLDTGSADDVTAIDPAESPDLLAISSSGSELSFSRDGAIRELSTSDLSSSELLFLDPSAVFQRPTFGNDDARLYTKRLSADQQSGQTGIQVIDRHTRSAWLLDVDARSDDPFVTWARFSTNIDRDRDGIANGLDPTPDGVEGCAIQPGDFTVGLWCFREGGGSVSASQVAGAPEATGIKPDEWSAGGLMLHESAVVIPDADVLDLEPPWTVRAAVTFDELGPADAMVVARASFAPGNPISGASVWVALSVSAAGSILCRLTELGLEYSASAESAQGLVSPGTTVELGCHRSTDGRLHALWNGRDVTLSTSSSFAAGTGAKSAPFLVGWIDAPTADLPFSPHYARMVLSALALERK